MGQPPIAWANTAARSPTSKASGVPSLTAPPGTSPTSPRSSCAAKGATKRLIARPFPTAATRVCASCSRVRPPARWNRTLCTSTTTPTKPVSSRHLARAHLAAPHSCRVWQVCIVARLLTLKAPKKSATMWRRLQRQPTARRHARPQMGANPSHTVPTKTSARYTPPAARTVWRSTASTAIFTWEKTAAHPQRQERHNHPQTPPLLNPPPPPPPPPPPRRHQRPPPRHRHAYADIEGRSPNPKASGAPSLRALPGTSPTSPRPSCAAKGATKRLIARPFPTAATRVCASCSRVRPPARWNRTLCTYTTTRIPPAAQDRLQQQR